MGGEKKDERELRVVSFFKVKRAVIGSLGILPVIGYINCVIFEGDILCE